MLFGNRHNGKSFCRPILVNGWIGPFSGVKILKLRRVVKARRGMFFVTFTIIARYLETEICTIHASNILKFNVADRLYILSLARLTSPDYSVVRHAWYFVQQRQSVQARQRRITAELTGLQ